MKKKKVNLNVDMIDQANMDAANEDYKVGETSSSEQKYQINPEILSSLNDLIRSGNIHLNQMDMDSFLKADDAGKKAMVEELSKNQKRRRINLESIAAPQGL